MTSEGIPDSAKNALELAAARVSQLGIQELFLGDSVLQEMTLSITPKITLRKMAGTTEHRGQGGSHLFYRLQIPSENIRYSIYVKNPTDDLGTNREALARAIMWFIPNYDDGRVFTHDELAIIPGQ